MCWCTSAKEVPAPAAIIKGVGLALSCVNVTWHGDKTFCWPPLPHVPCSFHPQLSKHPSAIEIELILNLCKFNSPSMARLCSEPHNTYNIKLHVNTEEVYPICWRVYMVYFIKLLQGTHTVVFTCFALCSCGSSVGCQQQRCASLWHQPGKPNCP